MEFAKPEVVSAKDMYKKVAKKLKVKKPDIYSMKYQKAANSIIENYKKKGNYTLHLL